MDFHALRFQPLLVGVGFRVVFKAFLGGLGDLHVGA